MNRTVLLRWLLAVVLVLAQQIGVCHAASHAPGHGTSHEHPHGIQVKVCDQCMAVANVEPGPGQQAGPLPVVSGGLAAPAGTQVPVPVPPAHAFDSRAPPRHDRAA